MIQNYIKIALRSFRKNTFYTGVALFGISITLAILIVFSAFLDAQLGDNPPFSKGDRMLLVENISLQKVSMDTLIQQGQGEKVDTFITKGENVSSTSSSNISYYALDNYFRDVDQVEAYTFYINDPYASLTEFRNNKKVTMRPIYTDASFFEVLDFSFLEGRPFDQSEVDLESKVLLISEKMAMEYFGRKRDLVGQSMTLGQDNFEILGVVKASSRSNFRFDLILPSTLMDSNAFAKDHYLGFFSAVFLCDKKSSMSSVRKDLSLRAEQMPHIPVPGGMEYNHIEMEPYTLTEWFAYTTTYQKDGKTSLAYLKKAFLAILFVFMLLPCFNLIKMNTGRILERKSEVGIRKAFGADRSHIIGQFVFENILLTCLGGILAFLLSFIVIYYFNTFEIIPNVSFVFNTKVFGYGLLIMLLFGLLSGILPSIKMSNTSIVQSLKNARS